MFIKLQIVLVSSLLKIKNGLIKYKLWKNIPENVKNHLEKGLGKSELETPKKTNKIFSNVRNTIIGSNYLCIKSIHEFCKRKNQIEL